MMYLGDYLEDATVTFPFCTNAADGGRESFSAGLEEADIVIFKDGAALTLEASTITITNDIGSRVGVHMVSVDMSNDTDFTTGSDYAAVLYASDETLDAQAPAGVLASWSCENRSVNVARWAGTDVTLSATSAKPEVDMFSVSDDATAANNIETAGENYSATRGLSGTALPAAAAGAAGGLPTDSAGKTSFNDIAATAVVSGGAITTSGGAVSTVTTTTTATNLTNAPTNGDLTATMKTSVETAVNAQIEANHLDHLFKTTYDPASKPGAADALLNELIESDAGVSRYTANALEQAPTGGSAPTVGEIADAVWEEAIADHSGTAGSVAEQLAAAGAAGDPWATALPGAYSSGQAGKIVGDNLNATVSSRASQTSVDDVPTVAEFEARTLVAANYGTAAAQATAQADLDTLTGTDGATLATSQPNYAPSKAGDQMALVNDAITAAKFDESTAFPLASADSGSTQVARTGADGDTLETLSDQVDGTATPAQVNTQVLDVLNTDTFAEPGQGAPAATNTLVAKIGYLFKAWRNRHTQTATEYALYADDAVTKDQEAVVSDDGTTFERGEVGTGA